MPNLSRLVESGVLGPAVTAGPLAAGIIYNSVATGKYADSHGVLGPYEAHEDGSVSATDSRSRRAKAFWEILSQNDIRCNVVNFPATGPAELINGAFVSPAFFVKVRQSYQTPADVPPGSVAPSDLLETLKEFLVAHDEIDAQTMALFVPKLQQADPGDDRLPLIAAALAQSLSVHAVATWLMENTEWDVMSVNYPAIEQLWGRFLRYNKPKLDWVDQQDFELYNEVCDSSVRLCDLLLGRLLELAGDDTSVLLYSARGYRPNDTLPQELLTSGRTVRESLCGPEGIFVMRGPGAGADELIHGARSLDICPTVLHLAGVTPGADMDGRVLAEALLQLGDEPECVESWEAVPPLRDVPAAGESVGWGEPSGLARPFVFGRGDRVQMDNDWRRLETLLCTSRREQALGPLVRLYYSNPLQVDKATMVAEALYLAGHVPSALVVMAPVAEAFPHWPIGMLMSGVIALHKGEIYQALDFFEQAGRDDPPIPQLFLYLGDVCMRLDRLTRAEEAYRRAVAIDPSFYYAHIGLAEVLRRTQDYQGAAESALRAVGVDYSKSAGHLALGKAAAELGQMDRARQAFAQALRSAPDDQFIKAHLDAAEQGQSLSSTGTGPGDAIAQLGQGAVEPTEAQRQQFEAGQATIQDALRDISQWLGKYAEDLAAAETKLDEYLQANAAARGVEFAPPAQPADVGQADQAEWTIRPPIPADQPVLRQMLPDIFDNASSQEVLLIHPSGTDDIQGGVTFESDPKDATVVKLGLSVRGQAGATEEDDAAVRLTTRLLRGAIARGAAGGARRLVSTFREDPGRSALRSCLEGLGFDVALVEGLETINMPDFRDRCLRIVRRYQRQQAIPADVRLIPLGEAPYESVDSFLHTFFEDGAGVPAKQLSPSLSRVMLKGDQIIACLVGYTEEPDTFVAARSCVHADYRRLWASPWLYGEVSRACCEIGLSVAQFCTDEVRYPDFVKIARRMGAKEIGRVYTMSLDLVAPWR